MGLLVAFLLAVLAFVGIGVLAKRSREVFVLRLDRGRVRIVRGRIPQRLVHDVQDIVEPRRESGLVRGMKADERVRLELEGVSEPAAQRLRNATAMWPLAKVLAAPPPKR